MSEDPTRGRKGGRKERRRRGKRPEEGKNGEDGERVKGAGGEKETADAFAQ